MAKDKFTFFLPTRKGSLRVKNKNTRSFSNIEGGLLAIKLNQLLNCTLIDEVILSTNDELCIEIANKFEKKFKFQFRIDVRPEELCLDSTNLQDLISYVPTITDSEHIIWGHVTTPFANSYEYDKAIEIYLSKLDKGNDSLVSVNEFQNFLLNSNGKIINNNTKLQWPRTQDLDKLYEINHVMFIAKREIYLNYHDRIGHNPILYTMDKMKSIDIDWEEDFLLAEIIYNKWVQTNKFS